MRWGKIFSQLKAMIAGSPVLYTERVFEESGHGGSETVTVPGQLEPWLTYLASGLAPADALSPIALDGFCAALAVAPEVVAQDEWIPLLSPKAASATDEVVTAAIGAAVAHSRAVDEELGAQVAAINAGRTPVFQPLFTQLPTQRQRGGAMTWLDGFFKAMELRHAAWMQLVLDETYAHITHPLMVFVVGPNGEPFYPDAPESEMEMLRDEAVVILPQAVVKLRIIAEAMRANSASALGENAGA